MLVPDGKFRSTNIAVVMIMIKRLLRSCFHRSPLSPPQQKAEACMHRCLQIDEILDRVVSYYKNKAMLVNIALTCRLFYDPAMNHCWHYLDHVSALIQLLPDDAIQRRTQKITTIPVPRLTEHWVCTVVSYSMFKHRLLITGDPSFSHYRRLFPFQTSRPACEVTSI